jgi:LL-diaminopimelate aminotransferase
MNASPSERLRNLPPYAFAELDRKAARLAAEGHDPIDFGVGDPTVPTPSIVRRATAEALERHAAGGYPSYDGEPSFRRAAAGWMERRFGVALDPSTEVTITVGSKEAIFNVPEAFVNPGDVVISPSPGYPPYERGTRFAEGINWFYPLVRENGFLPDVDSIPREVARRARLFWICQPHVPTGKVMEAGVLQRVIDWCRTNEVLLCSDEAYIDLHYEAVPDSLIQHAREGVLVFHSLSKRSAMTGYRCGWVAGDREAIAAVRRLKTNIDSGVPRFVQDGAAAALGDEAHVDALRARYRAARDRLAGALQSIGLPASLPEAGLYLWQRAPEGMTGLALADRLLEPDLALITAPGEWLSEPTEARGNPGRDFIRLAFVPPMDRIEEAVRRIEALPGGSL